MGKTGALKKKILGFVINLFFGFTWLDAVYLLVLSAVGSYLAFDVPLNIALFLFCFFSFGSAKKRWNRVAVFFLLAGFFSLAGSAALYGFFPKLSPENLSIRMFHQVFSRFYFIVFIAYLVLHLRSQWADQSPIHRIVARVGWLFLKISLWLAAFMSFMSIKGRLIQPHLFFLSLATPLLFFHILSSWRHVRTNPNAREAVKPLALTGIIGPSFFLVSAVVGLLVAVGFSLGVSSFYSRAYYGDQDFFIDSPNVTFASSPMTAEPNVRYQSRFLGDSAGCGNIDCHPYVYDDWVQSRHRFSVTNAYRRELEAAASVCGKRETLVCLGCHDPLSLLAGAGQDGRDLTTVDGRREGISCLVCHGLFASEARPANAAFVFRFPKYYYQQDLSSLSYFLALIREHGQDFNAPGYADDRQCVACHNIVFLSGEDRPINEWLGKSYHRQGKMIPACRGDNGCLTCHMPQMLESEKPNSIVHHHHFKKPVDDPTVPEPTDRVANGGRP